MRTLYLRLIAVCLFVLATCACSTTVVPQQEELNQQLDDMVQAATTETPESLTLHLPSEIRESLDEIANPRWSDRKKLRELRNFLFADEALDIAYDARSTKTASETFYSRKGNCLSMSNLFVAAARHIGLPSMYKSVTVRPTWNQEGSMMIRYEHIIAYGELRGGDDYIVDFLPEFSIENRRTERVSDRKALSHYYNNLGAEAVIDGNYEVGIEYVLKAIKLEPESSDAWNNLGAALKRHGDEALAEASYARSLGLNRNNYSTLSNLTQLYVGQGRQQEARAFIKKVNRYNKRNPFWHYYLAQLHFRDGDYFGAQDFLVSAIRLKRDEPDFYVALAETFDRLGEKERSERAYEKAEVVRNRLAAGARRPRNSEMRPVHTIMINP